MAATELHYLSIREASALIAAGELSPVTLTEAVFARIEETDARLHSFVRLMQASAIEEARAAERRVLSRERRGHLDGIPIAVKDLFDTAGVVTAAGTEAYRDRVPLEDATAVRRLRESGAVILGKTNTHELAMGGTTNNAFFGATHNPWALERVPGGSSGGSGAAIASGQALGALGTDTAGSIRIPAAFCGITGLKPTYGLVGRGGVLPLALTLDHAGPMARSAEDCALMLAVLAGHDSRDPDSAWPAGMDYDSALGEGIEGLRLGLIPSLIEDLETAPHLNFLASIDLLRSVGARIEEVEPFVGLGDDLRAAIGPILQVEAASYLEDVFRDRPQAMGARIRERLAAGLSTRGVDYARALETRKRVEEAAEAGLVAGIDAYVMPTSSVVAEEIARNPEDEPTSPLRFRNTMLFNQSRQPALSVPNGFDAAGLPTGLMIVGRRFCDDLVLRVGHAYQLATDFHRRRPPL